MSDLLDQPGDDVAPATFDLDAWIDGSKPTERSVTLVGRGDLIADIEDALRRYDVAKQIPDSERGINDDTPASIEARLEQLQAELDASRITVHVRALQPEEVDAARKAAEKAAEKAARRSGDPSAEPEPDYTVHMIAAGVTRITTADGATATSITAGQVLALRDRLGYRQVLRLVDAMNRAASEEPAVHAPFSRTSSPDPAGGAS